MTKFSEDQNKALSAPLRGNVVKERVQAGRTLSYIEGWQAIAEANRIFGFDGWTRETLDIRVVSDRAREIGRDKKPGFGISYIARVRVTVGDIVREGVGSGHGIDVDPGLAHESAIKEAETDAMKRALMTFGNPFGLALYDKSQENVSHGPDTDALMAAEATIDAAAKEGLPSLQTAWTGLDPDLKPALKTKVTRLVTELKAKAA